MTDLEKEMLEVLRRAKPCVGASAFNLGQSDSKNSQRSARIYREVEGLIDAVIKKAEAT